MAAQPHNMGLEAAPVFEQGEKIFAYHQGMLYEAKILKVESRASKTPTNLGHQETQYFIHYQGWKTKWDEWVNQDRMIKHTTQNREFQQTMRKAAEEAEAAIMAPVRKKSTRKLREPTPPPAPKRARKDPEEGDSIVDAPESLELPFVLQKILAEDYDMVCNQKNLIMMPVAYTVTEILTGFADQRLRSNENRPLNTNILSDLRVFFDSALGTLLLYRFERLQYQEIQQKMKEPGAKKKLSDYYGSHHLLRLFHLLPNFMEQSGLPEESSNLILFYVSEILEFMEKNVNELFSVKAHTPATETYCRSVNE